jgi:hypothetical protein
LPRASCSNSCLVRTFRSSFRKYASISDLIRAASSSETTFSLAAESTEVSAISRASSRRTFHRTVRTKDAAVAQLRAQQRFAVRALVEKLACLGRHRFSLSEAANGAYKHGFKKNFVHSRFSCGQRQDSPHLQSLWLAQRDSLYQDQTKRWQFSYRNPLSHPLPQALFLVLS